MRRATGMDGGRRGMAFLLAIGLIPGGSALAAEVAGTARLEGDAPPASPAKVPKDHRAACGEEIPDESVRTSAGALADVVVWLEPAADADAGPGPGAAPTADAGELAVRIEKCRFHPRIAVAPLGTTLAVTNGDRTHHIALVRQGDRTLLHVALPIPGQTARQRLASAGRVELRCTAGHPWARGFVQVVPTRWHAVTGDDGAWTLADVPAGRWTLVAWHETLGEQRRVLEVGAAPLRQDTIFRR